MSRVGAVMRESHLRFCSQRPTGDPGAEGAAVPLVPPEGPQGRGP